MTAGETSQLLKTIQDVGIVVVLLLVILMLLGIVGMIVWAFLRRSSAADAQVAKATSTSDRLAIALESATSAFKGIDSKIDTDHQFTKQYTEEQTKALTAVRDVIVSFQQSSSASDTKLSNQVTGVSDLLQKLLLQGDETLTILRKSPEEHAAIENKLDEFLKAVRRDSTLQTGEMNRSNTPTSFPSVLTPEPN